jgi:hypothetical protein
MPEAMDRTVPMNAGLVFRRARHADVQVLFPKSRCCSEFAAVIAALMTSVRFLMISPFHET